MCTVLYSCINVVVVSTIIVVAIVAGVGVGVGVVIIINPPNSSSGRYNDIAAIDSITVVVVIVANSVVIIDPRNRNRGGRFIAIAGLVVHVRNAHIAVMVVVVVPAAAAINSTLLRMLLWLLLFLPLLL